MTRVFRSTLALSRILLMQYRQGSFASNTALPPYEATGSYIISIGYCDAESIHGIYKLKKFMPDLHLEILVVSNAYNDSPYPDRRLLDIVIIFILLHFRENCPTAQSHNLCTFHISSTISMALP